MVALFEQFMEQRVERFHVVFIRHLRFESNGRIVMLDFANDSREHEVCALCEAADKAGEPVRDCLFCFKPKLTPDVFCFIARDIPVARKSALFHFSERTHFAAKN
jgi:hypothetical protein